MAQGMKLGGKVRGLRRREDLTQVQLAQRLGISASYLNLIEHNRRPLSAQLLIKLAQLFNFDIQTFAQDDEAQLVGDLLEAFGDPIFDAHSLVSSDVRELASQNPQISKAMLTLYKAYRGARTGAENLVSQVTNDLDGENPQLASLPSEEVSDLIQRHGNYFPDLEDAAGMLWKIARLDSQDMYRGLVSYLDQVHGIEVRITKEETLGQTVRKYDRDDHTLHLSEILAPRTRNFQLAHQIGLLDSSDILNRLAKDPQLSTDDARALCRVALANYFAGAVLMPYDAFKKATGALRYDIELLGHRFRTSFEQVCHRLTTLQRPGAAGIPFHLVRMDVAGNISKRFSASGFRFARFAGACPRWNEHAAFLTPDRVRIQISQMPDETAFFCVARTVRDNSGGFHAHHALHAVGIGCDLRFAGDLVYSEGIDLENAKASVPVGVACRVCERRNCEQRAFPRLMEPLRVDENVRGRSFYMDLGSDMSGKN